MLQLFDNYAATYSLLFIGLVECVVLSWVYGKASRLLGLLVRPSDFLVYSEIFVGPPDC